MFAPIYQWAALLALFQGVLAQSGGTFLAYMSEDCDGSSLTCSDLPTGMCCGVTSGMGFISGSIKANPADSQSFLIYPEAECSGEPSNVGTDTDMACFNVDLDARFFSWVWAVEQPFSPDPLSIQCCRTPDAMTIVEPNGQQTKIAIPDGEYPLYEQLLAKGDFDTLKELAKGRP